MSGRAMCAVLAAAFTIVSSVCIYVTAVDLWSRALLDRCAQPCVFEQVPAPTPLNDVPPLIFDANPDVVTPTELPPVSEADSTTMKSPAGLLQLEEVWRALTPLAWVPRAGTGP